LKRSTTPSAEHAEVDNHTANESFTKMRRRDLPPYLRKRRLTNLTWVYKTKRDGRRKARLCVQGCTQVRGGVTTTRPSAQPCALLHFASSPRLRRPKDSSCAAGISSLHTSKALSSTARSTTAPAPPATRSSMRTASPSSTASTSLSTAWRRRADGGSALSSLSLSLSASPSSAQTPASSARPSSSTVSYKPFSLASTSTTSRSSTPMTAPTLSTRSSLRPSSSAGK
jgi:hypothetical protein